jgi:hypothetical protein
MTALTGVKASGVFSGDRRAQSLGDETMFPKRFNDPGLGVALLALALMAAALVCGELAQAHMRRLGTICGLADAHCGWCYAAAALSVAAGAALALAVHWGARLSLSRATLSKA